MHKNNINDTTTIDGRMLYCCFIAGAKALLGRQDHLNNINVFPTPDADTGTNMAATMQMVIELSGPKKEISEVAHSIADAALWGGHGNSGIIVGQFLYGFASGLGKAKSINVDQFSSAIKTAVSYAYDALSYPVEGTIISVMRDWSDELASLKGSIRSFDQLFKRSYQVACQSLQDTPNKNEILARSKVVDAGAQGFVYFLDGIIDFLQHKNLRSILSDFQIVEIDTNHVLHIVRDIPYRYCCEAILAADGIDKNNIRSVIDGLGDSTIIAGTSRKVKIHQHTNTPTDLFESLSLFGPVIYQKVDDMKMQNAIATQRRHSTAIVTDTSFSIPLEEIDKFQIHVVPGRVNIGGTHYIDTLSINSARIYRLMENRDTDLPTTASPSYKDFIDKYNYLSKHYTEIIAFHGSANLSATSTISRKAAKEVSTKTNTKIVIIDPEKNSAELVLRSCEALDAGIEYDELLEEITMWIQRIEMIGVTTSLEHALRSGRLKNRGLFRVFKKVKPVFRQMESGRQKVVSISFSEKRSLKRTMRVINRIIAGKNIWGYTITHANNERSALWCADQIEAKSGVKARYVNQVSPSIGALVGQGAIAILIMFE